MPSPTYPIPNAAPTLHIYRHLLRECSYLPPAFQGKITFTVKDRFHRHRQHDELSKDHIRRAKSSLRTLRAANSGDKAAMESLISKGFGRSGSRRRELMARLVIPQGPSNSEDLQALTTGKPASEKEQPVGDVENSMGPDQRLSKKAFFEKWDQPKLLRILNSQKQQQLSTKDTASWPGTSIKTIDPDQQIPKETIWGKKPSDILIRTKRARWWQRNAEKIMPPLGKGEWDLLGRLGDGAQEKGEWMVPQRRAYAKPLVNGGPGTSSSSSSSLSGWDWKAHASQPIATVERPKSLKHQRRTGQKDLNPYGVADRDHAFSGRWFRRAYKRTWQITPTMSQNPNTLKYNITWGSLQSKVMAPTEAQMGIFAGVDKRGRKMEDS